MSTLTHAFIAVALSLSGAAADTPAEPMLEPATAGLTIELDDRSTLADSILGEDPQLSDFIRRLA